MPLLHGAVCPHCLGSHPQRLQPCSPQHQHGPELLSGGEILASLSLKAVIVLPTCSLPVLKEKTFIEAALKMKAPGVSSRAFVQRQKRFLGRVECGNSELNGCVDTGGVLGMMPVRWHEEMAPTQV